MEILEYELNQPNIYSTLSFMPSIAWIDIETDGLSHKNKLVIIGLIFFNKETPNGRLIQLFNDDGESEYMLLKSFMRLLKDYQTEAFISFNGDAFDLPFLNARLTHHHFNTQINKKFNIDLLKIARQNKSSLPIEKLNLKSIESFLDIPRKDTISGKDSIDMYNAYLASNAPKLRQMILLHNYDDLVNMIPLLKLLDTLNLSIKDFFKPSIVLANEKWILHDYLISNGHLSVYLSQLYYKKDHENRIEHIGSSYTYLLGNIKCEFLLKSFHQDLYVIDTDAVFYKSFNDFSNNEKQAFIVYNQAEFHVHNIQALFNHLDIQKQIKTLLT